MAWQSFGKRQMPPNRKAVADGGDTSLSFFGNSTAVPGRHNVVQFAPSKERGGPALAGWQAVHNSDVPRKGGWRSVKFAEPVEQAGSLSKLFP